MTGVQTFFFSSRRRHTRFSRDWSSTCALPILGTGSSILQAVFAYISMFLPFALFALLIGNAGLFLIGLDADHYIDSAQFLLPIVHMLNYFSAPLSSGQILSYVLLIAIIYLLGLWMYKARRLEVAGSAVSFDWLKPIFVFGLMLSLSAVLGMYFCMTQNQSRAWLYFGYILGALVDFVIAYSDRKSVV